MKKVMFSLVVLAVVVFTSLSNAAQAAYESITSDYKIQKALMVLDAHGEGATVRTLVRKNIQIKFTDLAMMSPAYMRYNALAAKDSRNNQYIFIDNKHKSAPVEALAALLAHEATHQNVVYGASIDEETQAHCNEAKFWIKVTASNPALKNNPHPLVVRENTLAERFGDKGRDAIQTMVASNSSYANLPQRVPSKQD